MDKIKGICRPYGDQTKIVTYIREFKSYETGLRVVKKVLTKGFKSDYNAFSVVLREFERQTKGRETDTLPLKFSLPSLEGNCGYFFGGKTATNDQVAAEIHYGLYNGELTEQIMRFSVFDPKVDMRKVLTEFSKDKKYEKGFGHFTLDHLIGQHRLASVESSYGFRTINWHIEGEHPLISEVYNNTLAGIASTKK